MKLPVIKLDKNYINMNHIEYIFEDSGKIVMSHNGTVSSYNVDNSKNVLTEAINKMYKAGLVLLQDTDKHFINYSNVTSFSTPEYDPQTKSASFGYVFKSGFKGSTTLKVENTGDTDEVLIKKLQKIYDQMMEVWTNNEQTLDTPFHKIDLSR